MSFSSGGHRGLRRGSEVLDPAAQPAEDDGEHSVDEVGDEEEEEEEQEEDEEEEEEEEEETNEEEEDEEVEDDDRTPDAEEEEVEEGVEEGGEEQTADDTGEQVEEFNDSVDDERSLDQAAADESYADEEEEPQAPSPSFPPSSTASAPFTFAPLASAASTLSAFPAFSAGGAASALAPSSAPPFSFSSDPSSSAPFSFPSSATFSVGLSGSSSAAIPTPFTFGSAVAAPPVSSSPPFTFASSASQPPSSTSAPSFGASPSLAPPSGTAAGAPSSAPAVSSTLSASAPPPAPVPASDGVITVPVAARGVSAVWGVGAELFLYTDARSNRPSSHPHSRAPFHASDVFSFRWPALYGETSGLLHSWRAVFLHVQQQARVQSHKPQRKPTPPGLPSPLPPLAWRDFLLAQSHCYRAELDAALYRAAQSLTSASTRLELARHGVSAEEYHAALLLLESAASTWHLFELLCLDSHDNITVQLVDWLQRSTPAPRTQGLQADSDEWWTALLQLLVQGRLPAVVDLLTDATASSSPLAFLPLSALHQLLELLQALPSLTAQATSVHHLVALIRDYQLAVQHLAASTSAFQAHPYLPALLSILAGDEAALATVCDDWMQLLVAQLIFVQPQTSKPDLPDLVQLCVSAMQAKDRDEGRAAPSVSLLAQLRQHVLCFRVHSAVLLADQIFELPFFTAHLVDLLHLAGAMPTLRQAEKPQAKRVSLQGAGGDAAAGVELTPRDWYLWQYALSIQSHDRLWTLSLDYMRAMTGASTAVGGAPVFSPIHAQCALVLSQPCDSSSRLLQLLALAAAHELPAFVGERLCERFANRMLREGQTGAAVYWFERSGEAGHRRIREVATRLLDSLIVGAGDGGGGPMDDGAQDGAEGVAAEDEEAAMEAVLDNVSDARLHEETGYVELALLQQWRDFALLRRQLRDSHRHRTPMEPRAPLNIFQRDRVDHMRDDEAADSRRGSDDERLALTQSAVALLMSLLTEPLLQPPHGPLQYTPQSLHPSLLRELSGLLGSIDASRLLGAAECSAAGWQAVLNSLNRCELSWRWAEWRKRAGLSAAEVNEVRTRLLSCLQSALLMEEGAKRVNVRV